MNWAHKKVGLVWIGLVWNVSQKWVSTHINHKHPFPFNKKIGGEISKAIYNYIITIEHPFPIKSKIAIPVILSGTQIRDTSYKSGKPYL